MKIQLNNYMKKLLIASDIHGSAWYCRKLLQALEREETERMLLLGDILYHGPRNDLPREYAPKDVIAMLNPLKERIVSVRGNCEAEVDQMVLEFPIMADYLLLPVGDRLIFATHGHIFNETQLPPLRPGDILLHGHTHVAACVEHETYTYCNPGSVALPKAGAPHSYMTLDGGTLLWKTLDGKEFLKKDIL